MLDDGPREGSLGTVGICTKPWCCCGFSVLTGEGLDLQKSSCHGFYDCSVLRGACLELPAADNPDWQDRITRVLETASLVLLGLRENIVCSSDREPPSSASQVLVGTCHTHLEDLFFRTKF